MANLNKTRYIKSVPFSSVNDIPNIDKKVNTVCAKIKQAGGNIVSINTHNFGLNPITLLFIIIYECDHEIEDNE